MTAPDPLLFDPEVRTRLVRPVLLQGLAAAADDRFDFLAHLGQVDAECLQDFGRQALAYGDERLIGPSEWNNFSRTFDAATTNSRPTPHPMIACQQRSPTSRSASEIQPPADATQPPPRGSIDQRNSAAGQRCVLT